MNKDDSKLDGAKDFVNCEMARFDFGCYLRKLSKCPCQVKQSKRLGCIVLQSKCCLNYTSYWGFLMNDRGN